MKSILCALLLLAGCGSAGYDIQCDGPFAVDCSLLDLPICTTEYGQSAPHAFCTRECDTDQDCGLNGVCKNWKFETGVHRVCIAPYWNQ